VCRRSGLSKNELKLIDLSLGSLVTHQRFGLSLRDTSLSTDENGALAITGIVTANVHLTSANSFTYSATIQIFDADGNLIFTAYGRTTGTRFQ